MTEYPWKPNELHSLVEGLPVPNRDCCGWDDNPLGYMVSGRYVQDSVAAYIYAAMLAEELAKEHAWIPSIMYRDDEPQWGVSNYINQPTSMKVYSGPTLLHAIVAAWNGVNEQ